ncbi:MAG TPA: histidinol dehydrogenase [Flavisolibacter sp.]|nr:histidinol dehydrogenase [Flavisolibacter sp.]
MQVVNKPPKDQWKQLLERPYVDNSAVLNTVREILESVQTGGDGRLKELTKRFEGALLSQLAVSEEELAGAGELIPGELKQAIQQAKENISKFHQAQVKEEGRIATMPGVECWRKSIGIEKVGLYVPGGSAPLFSTVLMLGIPAVIAGCKEIILCTPCNEKGDVHPAILYSAKLIGIKKVFKVGGAQAIAAMAHGTESIPAVYKIFGPGNQYVTAAKQLVQMQGIAIDMPAGPSEVCVWVDETADPAFAAADLLSQAEHGPDSQVLLVSTKVEMVNKVIEEVNRQVQMLPRKDTALKALANSKAIITDDADTAIELINTYAPEHLILLCKDADAVAEKITNAGSVFIGHYSPESVGDYASGTNHTLPTNGFATAYSGVSVDSFVKKITYQKLSREGLATISSTVTQMAEAEGLMAHANAVRVRMQ